MSLELYSKKDVELLSNHIDDIIKRATKKQMTLIEPFEDEIRKVSSIILRFIRDNKRKIYGGFALNLLIIDKNPGEAIYSDYDIPDIDFYSPDPLRDLVQLCNILHQNGLKNVMGREALHKETYNIRVGSQLYCDISYVPRNIYNKMPYREVERYDPVSKQTLKLTVIGPEFMMIDYYRMFTDMIVSSWRLEKSFKRFYLLQRYYPLPYVKNSINVPAPNDAIENVKILLDVIFNFMQENNTVVTIGFYAYNQFLKNSEILESDDPGAKKFKLLEIPYYEFITTEYKKDGLALIDLIKSRYPEFAQDIHVTEHYPFSQYLGHFAYIYYRKTLLAKIFTNNKRCVPFITVQADNNKKIDIGSFGTVLLYSLIGVMKARVDNDQSNKALNYAIISHLVEMRNFYLETSRKTIFDNTVFQEFIIECKGIPITPEHERQLIIEYRKRKNKKFIFSYDPSQDNRADINYVFANSSGNPIQNFKNLKLVPDGADENDIYDGEEAEDTNVSIE